MGKLYARIALAYFVAATAFLMVLAVILLGLAVWEVVGALRHGEVLGVLDAAGLVIVGFAIIETAKFVAEEEVLRSKELRSAVESRRSLTKFMTIVVIAVSLEALVRVFYPALLFAAAAFALVALGLFQWLSSRIAPPPDPAEGGGIDHRGADAPEE